MNQRFKAILASKGKAKPDLPEESFEKKIEWTPAYDKRSEGLGIHGMEMRAILRGPAGAISFTLFTNWQLASVSEELKDRTCGVHSCLNRPMPADIGYHSPKPIHEWQEQDKPDQKSCEFLGGAPCWYDGSGLNAQGVFEKFVEGGEVALWDELERWYKMTFKEGEG